MMEKPDIFKHQIQAKNLGLHSVKYGNWLPGKLTSSYCNSKYWQLFQVGGVPFTKLLGQAKHSTHKEEVLSEHKQSSSTSRKSSSGNVNDGAEGKKGLLIIIS